MNPYNKYLWQNSKFSQKLMSLVSETLPKIVVLRLIHLFDLCFGDVIEKQYLFAAICVTFGSFLF